MEAALLVLLNVLQSAKFFFLGRCMSVCELIVGVIEGEGAVA